MGKVAVSSNESPYIIMLAPVIPAISLSEEESNDYYVIAQSPNFTGTHLQSDINSKLNGRIEYYYGSHEDAFDSGDLQMIAHYKNGILEGDVQIWNNEGELYCEGQFVNNKKSGNWKFYHKNGMLKEEGVYNQQFDCSFIKFDNYVEPFITPDFFRFGSATLSEIQSAHVIPLLGQENGCFIAKPEN